MAPATFKWHLKERAVQKTDWRGCEIYVCQKKITEYGFSKPINLNAPGLTNEILKRKKLLKVLNSTQRSRRINI